MEFPLGALELHLLLAQYRDKQAKEELYPCVHSVRF